MFKTEAMPVSTAHMAVAFARLPIAEQALLPLAWIVLGLVSAALRILPFRWIAPLLGKGIGAVACVPLCTAKQTERARMVRKAINRAVRIAPFRSDCLPQAFTASVLCRICNVPVAVHLGLSLDDANVPLAAHAWVCTGGLSVTGGPSFGDYSAVACFVPSRLVSDLAARIGTRSAG